MNTFPDPRTAWLEILQRSGVKIPQQYDKYRQPARPSRDMMQGARLSETYEHPQAPKVQAQPGSTGVWGGLGNMLIETRPLVEGMEFEGRQRQGLDKLKTLDEQKKAKLAESAARGGNAPEKEKIGSREALTAAGIAALGRLFGARTSPMALKQYLSNRETMNEGNWQEAIAKYNDDLRRQFAQDQAALQGLEIDAGALSREMGFDAQQYNAKQQARAAAEAQKRKEFVEDRDFGLQEKKVGIEIEKLVPDTVRLFQSFYDSLVGQGVPPDQARTQAYNTAFYQAFSALAKEEREGRLGPLQRKKLEADIADTLKTTELRPKVLEIREKEADNMAAYRDGSLALGNRNADISQQNANTNQAKAESAAQAQMANPIIKEKQAIITTLTKQKDALLKVLVEEGLIDETGKRIITESTTPEEISRYVTIKKKIDKIDQEMGAVRKRIGELRAGPFDSGASARLDSLMKCGPGDHDCSSAASKFLEMPRQTAVALYRNPSIERIEPKAWRPQRGDLVFFDNGSRNAFNTNGKGIGNGVYVNHVGVVYGFDKSGQPIIQHDAPGRGPKRQTLSSIGLKFLGAGRKR